ncbi:bifunctional [glutamine synthetase] adenylyltransferase/[glutamine synthetase]-adenylyl-L-tyrosine phosphorylase [Agrobacterium larrymoorei]|uniref:Bifunctional glutamine synthetase adenylyltransferase/adenylyl-removing enzyme n=1 Tax=Agrobacterium larrymoorei TaxID=160699 RepID=A0A4D7DY71_9HYPH|nr:bifunctional [glutamine synthetase] adenylyltransferase/[glutamine synthetase]-adenylyl-L-tyrosine phosphorylase [Agrobacterium larrymoorei]QCI99142.1 bifunctional [glutamine synthetase] adenylyltransferase/[glutamine synthetase]-adenylyl-L-tyrosine phosphorylase [Agrobacterium larrymoorei]QYA08537.1 bifunctional [glutamine synthetase] adenylyltransferase/[glutamine synthetase]-adenylyl-L-tyrosine phosphorylase [Agrobacterium larrymoorei]
MRLDEVRLDAIRTFTQTELKSVLSSLKDIAKRETAVADLLASDDPLKDFVANAFTLSPYLRDAAVADEGLLTLAISEPVETALAKLVTEARDCWRPNGEGGIPTEAEVMTSLRVAKRRLSFIAALADLGRVFTARDTTRWLSDMADAALAAAIDHLLLANHNSGKLKLKNVDAPSEGSGLVVLGMGKLGARELNYSSDIDAVVFFEPSAGIVPDPLDALETFGRMMRRLIRIMQERTADGYVFRTDLRLRPDPGSTPLAIPVEAALTYYEGRGQNWERAAYIKARPVAGDIKAGEGFLRELTPFVFRKYLDYAAIADIHSIKRQIHAHKGHGAIAVKGHNVKLGRGGIREIEFFAQTQQLIAGGRMAPLRVRSTQEALAALTEAKWIDADTRDRLTDAYWFLREVEHRIQMVRDEQTHILPETEAELKRIAFMLGFADTKSFSEKLEEVLRLVERKYSALFEQETKLSGESGNLVFTGQKDDPDTLKTLARLGFERPEDMSRVIRTWHNGRYRATQSVEARERLTELTPDLLKAFGASKRADEALLRFDNFLSGLPAGIQLFSLLGNNPALLSLLVTIMSSAPRLAEIIAARPHVFDGMLDPALMTEIPTRDYLSLRMKSFLSAARHYEDILDRLRIFAAEQRFLIGVRLLTGAITGDVAGRAFTHLSDLVIEASLNAVLVEMEAAHGRYPSGRVAVMGMGKLGSFELTAGSDVDLILLYDYDDAAAESDGAKPLDAVRYFTRVTQRLISALSAPTAEGVLYEVDMRLRPSGNKGPVATRISTFEKYQREEAWTWEHLALSRARLICGDATLMEDAQRIIESVLSQKRDVAKIAADVQEMRKLIGEEKPPVNGWDFKLIPGGLVDLEFIAQYLTLIAPVKELPAHKAGESTSDVLKRVAPAAMEPQAQDDCIEAMRLFTELSQIIRLCIDSDFEPKQAPAGLIDLVCRAVELPDISTVEGEVKRLSKAVRKTFQTVLKEAG